MIGQTSFGTDIKETLNARDLHAFLQSKQQFADWIKNKLNKVGFKEGLDFIIHKIMNNSKRGPKYVEYFVTTETAKQIALMENTDVGYEYRTYLIDRDKKLTNIEHEQIPQADYGHTAEIADHARIRLAMRLGGKAYAIKVWNETSFGAKMPIDTPAPNVVGHANPIEENEAIDLLQKMITNPPYEALCNKRLAIYIKRMAVRPLTEKQLKRAISGAGLRSVSLKIRGKAVRVKILVNEHLSNEAIRTCLQRFDVD